MWRVTDELVLVGWTLIRPVPSPHVLGRSLPPYLTTISQCIQDDLPRPEWADWTVDRSLVDRARLDTSPDTAVMAVAMPEVEAHTFLSQARDPGTPSLALLRRHELARGEPLGFEVVGTEPDLVFHSWHCHGYADLAVAALGVRLTERGLLSSATDAKAVRDWMLQLTNDQAPYEVPWTYIALIPD